MPQRPDRSEVTFMNANSWAARFLEFGQESGTSITNMKLQKLVSLAESASEYVRSSAAFDEAVQAWDHGPAVYSVYARYKRFQNSGIDVVDRAGTRELADEDELIAREVWGVAGRLTAGGLRKLTHDIGPWPKYYRDGVRDIVLPSGELGAAWPAYVGYAQRLIEYRDPVETQLLGGFRSEAQRQEANLLFRVDRPTRRSG